jgi:hypothetical protein
MGHLWGHICRFRPIPASLCHDHRRVRVVTQCVPTLSRWLSCLADDSTPGSASSGSRYSRTNRVSPEFSRNPDLSLRHSRRVVCASLTINRGITANASQQLERGSPRGIRRSTDPATAAGLPNDGPRPLHDLPARSRASLSMPGADRCSGRGVGRIGNTGLARGAHPAPPRDTGALPVAPAAAGGKRASSVHLSGAAVPSTSMSSATTCTAPSSLSSSSMGANAGLFGFSQIRVCRHVSPSAVFSLSYRFTV